MAKILYERLSDLIMRHSLGVSKDDLICLQGSDVTVPLMGPLAQATLAAGGHPFTDIKVEDVIEAVHLAPDVSQSAYKYQLPVTSMKEIQGIVKIHGAHNTRYLSEVPLDRVKAYTEGQAEMRTEYLRRINDGSLKWCVTLFPCHAIAQDSNMSLMELEELMYRACMLDHDDPVAAWEESSIEQMRLCRILETKREMRVVAEGTDLTMGTAGRKWVSCHGKNNMPDGEVFTSPIEDATNGVITYSYPAIHNSREVQNVVLTFKDGVCVEARASKDEEYLNSVLDTDEGARILGEFAFGCNKGLTTFTKNILMDEKIAGTIHCAVGNSYAESGGKNQSSIHWDMICNLQNGGKVYADGELIYENGLFVI